MGDWRHTTWGDEVSLEYGKALRGYADGEGRFRVFGTNGPVGWTSEPLAPGPGVILGRKGAYRGVRYSPDPFFVIDTAYFVVPKTDLHMRWLYYAVIYHKLGEIDDGSPIPSTTRAAVYVRELEVPPPPEQRAIATALGTLDDKIDLNRRMNETLEAMARSLFKSWFVDFEPVHAKMQDRQPAHMDADTAALFPSSFENDGGLPLSWARMPLIDLTTKIGSGATPRGGSKAYVAEGPHLIRSQNVYDHEFVWKGLVRITGQDAERLKGVAVEAGDVLLNITGASILRTCVVDPEVLPARVNQHVAIIRATDGIPHRFLHQYLVQQSVKAVMLGYNAGGSREAITKGHLEEILLNVPPKQLLAVFEKTTSPLFAKIDANLAEVHTLAKLRDTLLPKLMSGEIRVSDAEQAAGEAT